MRRIAVSAATRPVRHDQVAGAVALLELADQIDERRRARDPSAGDGVADAREVLHDDPLIVFPGNIQGRHMRETGGRGCMLVTVDRGRVVAAEHRALDVMRWETCRVRAEGAAKDVVLNP